MSVLLSGGGDGGDEHNRKKTDGFQTPRGQLQVCILNVILIEWFQN